jgi:hypothetical protein
MYEKKYIIFSTFSFDIFFCWYGNSRQNKSLGIVFRQASCSYLYMFSRKISTKKQKMLQSSLSTNEYLLYSVCMYIHRCSALCYHPRGIWSHDHAAETIQLCTYVSFCRRCSEMSISLQSCLICSVPANNTRTWSFEKLKYLNYLFGSVKAMLWRKQYLHR